LPSRQRGDQRPGFVDLGRVLNLLPQPRDVGAFPRRAALQIDRQVHDGAAQIRGGPLDLVGAAEQADKRLLGDLLPYYLRPGQ
jgi:hypothetical protein